MLYYSIVYDIRYHIILHDNYYIPIPIPRPDPPGGSSSQGPPERVAGRTERAPTPGRDFRRRSCTPIASRCLRQNLMGAFEDSNGLVDLFLTAFHISALQLGSKLGDAAGATFRVRYHMLSTCV